MATESATFIDDVFEQHNTNYDTTSFVLNRDSPQGLIRWSSFLLHNTNQFFIKVSTISDVHLDSLISLLAFAEELGIEDAFVCVERTNPDCGSIVEQLQDLDFCEVPQNPFLSEDFVILRFGF